LFSQQILPHEVLQIEKHEDLTLTSTPCENVEELTQEMIEHESLSSDLKEKARNTFYFIFLSYMFATLCASKCFIFILVCITRISGRNYIIGTFKTQKSQPEK